MWGMDRSTFRRIILVSRMAQRERFEVALATMSVFSRLSPVQRASIADCLVLEVVEVHLLWLSDAKTRRLLLERLVGAPCQLLTAKDL